MKRRHKDVRLDFNTILLRLYGSVKSCIYRGFN